MNILFITGNYPSASRPFEGTFVQQFVWAMARQGNECVVIKPTSINNPRNWPYPPLMNREKAGRGSDVDIIRTPFISASSKKILFFHTGRWSQLSFNLSAELTIRAIGLKPQVIYGHFLCQAGYAATRLGEKLGCPSVVGVGESGLWSIQAIGEEAAKKHFEKNGYFLSNSTKNKATLIKRLEIDEKRINMEPNGVDLDFIYPRDKQAMCGKYGISNSKFTVAFVGSNEVRKGPGRVLEALDGLADIQCIMVGSGTQNLSASNLIAKGPRRHAEIPELLSCADIFVLPTTSEGSCNAVIEAMACGLPVITADGAHMDDLVNDDVSIRINPLDVNQIRVSIQTLKRDEKRRKLMSKACLEKARRFDINKRAQRVSNWMEELVRNHKI